MMEYYSALKKKEGYPAICNNTDESWRLLGYVK
jgi:hypothetical protein